MSVGALISSWAWIDIPILIGICIVCFVFNKQSAEMCRQSQKQFRGADYELKLFRIPIYIIGTIFVLVIVLRLIILT